MNDKFISNDNINSYIETLINQSFSILPLYEENGKCEILTQKIDNIFHRINGFFKINNFDSKITIDILSFASELKDVDSHSDVRCCVLKICSLLSQLKVVTE